MFAFLSRKNKKKLSPWLIEGSRVATQVFNASHDIRRGPISIDSLKPKEPEYAWPHHQILSHTCFPNGLKKWPKTVGNFLLFVLAAGKHFKLLVGTRSRSK